MDKILYEEKQKTYLIFYVIIILILAIEFAAIVLRFAVAKNILGAAFPLPLSIILFAVFSFVLINFFYLRIKITEKDLSVSYGIFRLRVPREKIKACRSTDFSWKTYLGWGMRPGFDGTFAWTSRGHRGVKIETEGRNFIISTDDAEKICKVLVQ